MLDPHSLPHAFFPFFIQGLIFFFLGAAAAANNLSDNRLKLAGSLPFLAGFALSQGLYGWCESYLVVHPSSSLSTVHYAALFTLTGSFLFLNLFAFSLLRNRPGLNLNWVRAAIALPLLWLGSYFWLSSGEDLKLLREIEILSRLTIGTLGAGLACYALRLHARDVSLLYPPVALNLRRAGISFGFFAVVAGLIPAHSQLPVVNIPVELPGIGAALAITFFLVRALSVLNLETRRKLELHLRQLGQAEKLAALGKLAAGIAHEINNPLTVASLNIQILRAKLEAEGAESAVLQKLSAAEKSIDKASSIANDLLNLSRQTRRTQEKGELSVLDLNAILREAASLPGARSPGITVQQDLNPLAPIRGDADKLQQVFVHLLNNAVDAMPEGGLITLRSYMAETWLVVELQDTGEGIPEELLSRVFEPFFTTKQADKGTGLGLAVSYSTINQHNGRIELKSTVGKGTTVIVKLPVEGV